MSVQISFTAQEAHRAKNGKIPIRLVVRQNRKQKYMVVKYRNQKLFVNHPGELQKALSSRPGKHKELSDILTGIKQRAESIVKEIYPFTFEEFKKRFTGNYGQASDLFFWFRRAIDSANSPKTAEVYRNAMQSIQRVMKVKEIPIIRITPKWLDGYKNKAEENGLSATSINIYLRQLKAVINTAIKNGSAQKNPFENYKIFKPESTRKGLKAWELKKLWEYSSDNWYKQWARDIFILSYLMQGVNPGDIFRLKWSNIILRKPLRACTKDQAALS